MGDKAYWVILGTTVHVVGSEGLGTSLYITAKADTGYEAPCK